MDALRSCFGKKPDSDSGTTHDTLDDDTDPLLPQYNNAHTRLGQDAPAQRDTIPRGKSGRVIDLGPSNADNPPHTPPSSSSGDLPFLGKLVDILAALKAGKLPSQDQITRILQVILKSDFLKERDGGNVKDANYLYGTGPTTKRGLKALVALASVLQAALEFGMEKNDDNRIQDFFYQLGQVEVEGPDLDVGIGFNADPASKVAEGAKAVGVAGKEALADVNDKVPKTSEVASDTAILLHALRTLVQSALTSTIFRHLFLDSLGILRDLAAYGASDVSNAALQVHLAAKDAEANLTQADVGKEFDQVVEGIKSAASGQGLQEKGKEVAGNVIDTTREVHEGMQQKTEEWTKRGEEAKKKVEDDILVRIQQILVHAREDPASRGALRAILILIRKYADVFEDTGDSLMEAAKQVVSEAVSVVEDAVSPQPSQENMEAPPKANWQPPSTYPPPPNLYIQQGQARTSSKPSESPSPPPLNQAFLDLKVILERMASGHSLDSLLNALAGVLRDLNDLPFEVEEMVEREVYEDLKGKGKADDATPSHQEKGKHGKKKKKKGKKGGAAGRVASEYDESGGVTPSSTAPSGIFEQNKPNVVRRYFARAGRYLDRAMDEPGWVMSRKGTRELEGIYQEGVEILNVVGEAAVDVGEAIVEGNAQADDPAAASKVSEDSRKHALALRRRFRSNVQSLTKELERYMAAVENDRSSMKLLRSLEQFTEATSRLFSTDAKTQRRRASSVFGAWIRSSLDWTEWAAWAIPRILKLVPLSALPIPSLEARSESGGWEAGLYALFAKGEASKAGVGSGRRDKGMGKSSLRPVQGGIETTLVPDEIVVKEWTEVRIDMLEDGVVDERPGLGPRRHSIVKNYRGRDHHLISERSFPELHVHGEHHGHNPRVDTTSRIHFHVDGIRARIDGMGYYVNYGGPQSWFGYEDEGIVNLDIGMGRPHAGLGCDVEIEVTSRHATTHHQHDTPERVASPMVGEGIEGEGDLATLPGIVIQEPGGGIPPTTPGTAVFVEGEGNAARAPAGVQAESSVEEDGPANIDIQWAIDSGPVGREREHAASKSTGLPVEVFGHRDERLEPLFRVMEVHVHMMGVKVLLEKSRHWILNKLLVQPLAGPTVHQAVKRVLEAKIKESLERLAMELARLARDAADHGEVRRERTRRERVREKRRRIEDMIKRGNADETDDEGVFDALDEEEETLGQILSDWAHAIAQSGSRFVEKRAKAAEQDIDVRTDTGIETTRSGIIYHSSTTHIERGDQPISPPMVFNKQKQKMEPVKEEFRGRLAAEEVETDQADITVAIGGGAQLFADRQVPYGYRNDASGAPEEEGLLGEAAHQVGEAADGAGALKDRVDNRFQQDLEREKRTGWRSEAFDF